VSSEPANFNKPRIEFISWQWCDHCQVYALVCPKCQNNCCNAGHGEVDGKPCDLCQHIYPLQMFGWETNKSLFDLVVNPELVQPRIDGKPFRCSCSGNIFRKHGSVYVCNACNAIYEGVPMATVHDGLSFKLENGQ